MAVEEKTVYVAGDGTQFDTKESAQSYEEARVVYLSIPHNKKSQYMWEAVRILVDKYYLTPKSN